MSLYASVVWTTGDILTETKLDNMVANDQSEDAHAANGMIMNNNVPYRAKEAGGTLKDLLKLNTSDKLELRGKQIEGWTSWNPSWTNLTVGNGTERSTYVEIGGLVVIRLNIVFGSTTSISGSVTFNLPVTAAAQYGSILQQSIGHLTLHETGTNVYQGYVFIDQSTTQAGIYVFNAAATYVTRTFLSSTIPFTWETGDSIGGTFVYEAA